MNTDLSEIDSEKDEINESPPKKEKPPRSGRALGFLALLVALTALAGTAWMWWQDEVSQSEAEGRTLTEIARLGSSDAELELKIRGLRDRVESLPSADHTAELNALESRLRSGIADVERVERTLDEQLALTRSLQTATEAMQGRLEAAEAAVAGVAAMDLDAGGELDLAEVDYLLRLANERLKLFLDPVAADEVLELADMHLAAMDNPMYLGVRQEIASARRELAGLEMPDYFSISSELDSIQSALDGLKFRDETQAAEAPQQEQEVMEQGWWDKLKGVFSGLVTVRRSTDQENDRISLQDRDYVRQRLWLQLEIAHLSLMRRDQEAFNHALDRVRSTLVTWFDEDSESARSIIGRIDSLEAMDIQVDVPDINQPWATLRLIREGRAQPVTVPVPATQPSEPTEAGSPVETDASPQVSAETNGPIDETEPSEPTEMGTPVETEASPPVSAETDDPIDEAEPVDTEDEQ